MFISEHQEVKMVFLL